MWCQSSPNTGKEREETLRFVHKCASRWNVKVHWVEWREGKPGFKEVDFNLASRFGEPFAALIAKKQYLPNAVTRFCTQELKIRPMRDFCRSLGWDRWINVIGLRYDEGMRVLKALGRNDDGKERFSVAMPLSRAHITKRDIMLFWLGANADPKRLTNSLPQGFDLGLSDHEGNCDLCFLKGRSKLAAIMRDQPGLEAWWINEENVLEARFVTERSYSSILQQVNDQDDFFMPRATNEHEVECGLICQPTDE